MVIFKGATRLKSRAPKKKNNKIKRDGLECTCGALKTYWSTLHYLHDKDCIINKEK